LLKKETDAGEVRWRGSSRAADQRTTIRISPLDNAHGGLDGNESRVDPGDRADTIRCTTSSKGSSLSTAVEYGGLIWKPEWIEIGTEFCW